MNSALARMKKLHLAGVIGLFLTTAILVVALVGPYLSPESITSPVGLPYAAPSRAHPLGTDVLGRDVLSRLLAGGRTVILLAGASTLIAIITGVALGMIAAWQQGRSGMLILRAVDVFLALPALLVVGLLSIGLGRGWQAVLIATTLLLVPDLVRLVRSATIRLTTEDYAEAAVARGEWAGSILGRELLPNLMPLLAADAGLRLLGATTLVASASFLGFGLQPPTPDWAVMIQENRSGLMLQPWAVLAPTVLIGLFCIGACWLGDALARIVGGRIDGDR